ncbi:hypothetical protein HY734_01495 [Candidatus Uhrbacteria bacterium]|nr:hypothetical protein [Candidatus Uhrbacteria bacterium]
MSASSSSPAPHWHEGLKLASYCPLCETRYQPAQARVVGNDGETHLLHMRCRKCANAVLALVLVNQAGMTSVGLVTDLTYDDVVRFRTAKRLSTDDVLQAHVWASSRAWNEALSAAPSPRAIAHRRPHVRSSRPAKAGKRPAKAGKRRA